MSGKGKTQSSSLEMAVSVAFLLLEDIRNKTPPFIFF
jgi:hypothetical protein